MAARDGGAGPARLAGGTPAGPALDERAETRCVPGAAATGTGTRSMTAPGWREIRGCAACAVSVSVRVITEGHRWREPDQGAEAAVATIEEVKAGLAQAAQEGGTITGQARAAAESADRMIAQLWAVARGTNHPKVNEAVAQAQQAK